MKRKLAAIIATSLVFVMSVSASAAVQSPDRVVPGEISNNAVLAAEFVEVDTFIPVSTGVGQTNAGSKDDPRNFTSIITHVNKVYTPTAKQIAAKLGANVVGAFHVTPPVGLTKVGVEFDVKEGFTLPENPVFISLHGKAFCTPERIIRVSDRKFVIIFNTRDSDFYMLDGGDIELDKHISYREFFSGQ